MPESSSSLLSLSYVLGKGSTPVPLGSLGSQGGEVLNTGDLDSRFAAFLADSEAELQQLQAGLGVTSELTAEQLEQLLAAQLDAVSEGPDAQIPVLSGDAIAMLAQWLGGKELPQQQQDLPVGETALDGARLAGDDDNVESLLLNTESKGGDTGGLPSSDAGGSAKSAISAAEIAALLQQLQPQLAKAHGPHGAPDSVRLSRAQNGGMSALPESSAALFEAIKSQLGDTDQVLLNQVKTPALSAEAGQLVAAQSLLKNQQLQSGESLLPKAESILEGLKSLDGGKLTLETGVLEALAAKVTDTGAAKVLTPDMLQLSTVPLNFRSATGSTVAAAQVQSPVFSPEWGGQVAEKLVWFSVNNIRTAELQLDPPDLGPLQVRIHMQNDQASIHFTSSHAAVRDALDQSLPRLREIFFDNGLNLADVDVSDQSSQESKQPVEQQVAATGADGEEEGTGQQAANDTGDSDSTITHSLHIVDAYA